MEKTRIVGISGGSGSGKTTIVQRIADIIPDFTFVAQDYYYKSAENVDNKHITEFNFDHPDAFDSQLLYTHLRDLKAGRSVDMPQYDFVHHCRTDKTIHTEPQRLIIFEGILIFFERKIRDLIDLKLYVDTPDDIRFIRRLNRDIKERGRTVESVITQYMTFVRPGHYNFIEPTKVYADLVIPEGGNNERALEVLATFMRNVIENTVPGN